MRKKLPLIFGFGIMLTFFAVNVALAKGLEEYLRPENLPVLKGTLSDTEAATQARFLIGDIITVFLGITGLIAVYSIVNNAFWLVAAFGKGESIDQRKKALFWAVGALVLIILSYVAIQFVVEFVVGVAEEVPVTQPGGTAPVGSSS